MARPTLLRHRKFRRLSAALDGNDALALGSLELLWHNCYETGDDYLGAESDIEAIACWRGAPGVLFQAFIRSGDEEEVGFIEEVEGSPGRYKVHDFYHHAPSYVKARMEREAERRAKGITISELRAEAGRRGRASAAKAGLAPFQKKNAAPTPKPLVPAPKPAATPAEAPIPKVRGARAATVRKVAQEYSPQLMDTAAAMIEMWHRQDPKDGRVIEVSLPMLAMRLQSITQSDPRYTLELCMAGAKAYLAEKRERYSAAHYFFGVGKAPEGPKYPAYLDAILAARSRPKQEVG